MAEIIQEEGHKKGGKRRPKKHSTHIDMTPMVDLMCLLITFFMLTTAFSKPKAMEIFLPHKDKDPTQEQKVKIKPERTINVILDENDVIYYYIGLIDPNKPAPELVKTDFSKDGIRKLLLTKNKALFQSIQEYKDKVVKGEIKLPQDSISKKIEKFVSTDQTGPVVLIKPYKNVKYKNFVNILDELSITNIGHYAVVELNPLEIKLLEATKNK